MISNGFQVHVIGDKNVWKLGNGIRGWQNPFSFGRINDLGRPGSPAVVYIIIHACSALHPEGFSKFGQLLRSRKVTLGSLLAECFKVLRQLAFVIVGMCDLGHAVTEGDEVGMSCEVEAA